MALTSFTYAGNSGGPLLDSSGKLIGVNTAIFTNSVGPSVQHLISAVAMLRNLLRSPEVVQNCDLEAGDASQALSTDLLCMQGTSAGVGFAISAAAIARAVPQLIQFGKVTRPSLRIQVAGPLSNSQRPTSPTSLRSPSLSDRTDYQGRTAQS